MSLDEAYAYVLSQSGTHFDPHLVELFKENKASNEDRTRMTKGNMAHAMACINNLVIGLLIGKKNHRYLPEARRFYAANLIKAFELILVL